MKTKELLRRLTEVPAVSGFERELGASERIASFLPAAQIDELGNVLARLPGRGRRILIDAHLDEVGFLKTDAGFVKVGDIGDSEIKVENIETMGKLAYFRRAFEEESTLVRSPALDNKVGCTALIMVAKELQNSGADVWLAFTVQEETTRAGIRKVMNQVKPDVIISVDSAYAQPFKKGRWSIPICGKGPAIQPQGKNFIIKCTDWIEKIAKDADIPYQFEIVDSDSGATNLSAVTSDAQLIQINIPVRYQHSAMCETDVRDIENATKLIVALARGIKNEN